jgi:hypothetical protein
LVNRQAAWRIRTDHSSHFYSMNRSGHLSDQNSLFDQLLKPHEQSIGHISSIVQIA